MSKFNSARAIIDEFIRKNGQGEITGEVLNNVLHSMLDDVSVATDSDVTKDYVDTKTAEAQAAAEQYIQNEVLTDYATTKYVGEREEYLVGYAEGLVSDLESEIDGRGYLTSAAMDSYATKEDIKNFVTKGSTLDHYGITDAVRLDTYNYVGDINDLLTSSVYGVMSNQDKADSPADYGVILTLSPINAYFRGQLFISSDDRLIMRVYEYDHWNAWSEIITAKNVGSYTLSRIIADELYLQKAGGTMTGRLTANGGINANYLYNGSGYSVIEAAADTYINAQCAFNADHKLFLFYANELQVINKGWGVKFSIQDNLATFNIPLKSGAITSSGAVTATGFVLGGVNVDSWTSFVGKNAYLMPTNSFDNLGMMQVNFLSNALYAAGQRYDADYNGLASFDLNALTDGDYENGYTACRVPAHSTGSFTIYHSDGRSLIDGYPYGNIILSFYYTNIPSSITVEVFCNYESQGVGWKTLTRTEVRGSQNGVYAYHNPYYNITQLRVTMSAGSEEVHLSEIDFQLERGKLENLPAVTKFAVPQTLYGNITFAGGITLGNKTITSWDEIKASGDYLPLTGGTLTGALTISAGQSLNIGSASLAYKATSPDNLNKLVISSLVSIGNLYMRERLYIEASTGLDARIAFRDSNGTITDYIDSFDDLRIKVVERTETSGVSIAPNVLNRWTTPLTGALTINFSAGRSTVANYYMIEFKTGETIPTITLPDGITWQGGDNLLARLEPNKTYQISVLNYLAVGGAF